MDERFATSAGDLSGQVTVAEVGAWKYRREQARLARDVELEKVSELQALTRRHQQVEARCQSKQFTMQAWQRFRAFAENMPLQRTGVGLIITALTAGLFVICTSLISLDGMALTLAVVTGLTLGATIAVFAVYFPPDSDLIGWEAAFGEQLDVESKRAADFSEQLREAHLQAEQAEQTLQHVDETYQRYASALNSRRHRLLATDWRSLRGGPFERFLAEVFSELGYQVQLTKSSGDQGVDLLVVREGVRTAIQVKGYADAVGNGAVQEAHAGMAFYDCQQCAVVTNSTFTSSAKSLARRVGCTLIDGSQIDRLIRGEIDL